VAQTLCGLARGVQPSEVWRGAAFVLLRLNPKECEALGLVFEDESVRDDLRGLILDLLAGAGTFEAQVVIRRLLALAVARRTSRTFAGYVQRLGFVEGPDGPTLRFLMSVYAESRAEAHDVRAACAYALGAAAGNAFTAGEPEAAIRASDVLRRDLLSAGSVVEKCALLTALGNAGIATDVMLLTRFTQDAQSHVRAAAAIAMRKMSVPEARTQLVALLADCDPKVAQSALVALSEQKLDDEELEKVAELVLGGRTSLAIDARVLRLLVAQRPRLTSCPGRAGAIETALRLLLGRVEAAEPRASGSGERRVGSASSYPPARRVQSSAPPATLASPPPPPVPLDVRAVQVRAVQQQVQRVQAQRIGFQPPRAPAPPTVIGPPMPYSGSYRILSDAADAADAAEPEPTPRQRRR
jgi:hypothetical protein